MPPEEVSRVDPEPARGQQGIPLGRDLATGHDRDGRRDGPPAGSPTIRSPTSR